MYSALYRLLIRRWRPPVLPNPIPLIPIVAVAAPRCAGHALTRQMEG